MPEGAQNRIRPGDRLLYSGGDEHVPLDDPEPLMARLELPRIPHERHDLVPIPQSPLDEVPPRPARRPKDRDLHRSTASPPLRGPGCPASRRTRISQDAFFRRRCVPVPRTSAIRFPIYATRANLAWDAAEAPVASSSASFSGRRSGSRREGNSSSPTRRSRTRSTPPRPAASPYPRASDPGARGPGSNRPPPEPCACPHTSRCPQNRLLPEPGISPVPVRRSARIKSGQSSAGWILPDNCPFARRFVASFRSSRG